MQTFLEQLYIDMKKNLDTDLIFLRKIKSEWLTVTNVNAKVIKCTDNNVREKLDDLGFLRGSQIHDP